MKLDKSKYTKEEFQKLLEQRRKEKSAEMFAPPVAPTPVPPRLPNQLIPNNYGFVIGNGTSRQGIDLNYLKPHGKIYGCNALYREFEPDYLIAVDVKMINEIEKTKWQHTHTVWTNPNKAFRNYEGFNYFQPSRGWSSGPTALWLSVQHGYKKIFILGFDYAGLDENKRVNNIYSDTQNYKKSTDGATYYGNWLKQTCQVIRENSKIAFYRVILPDNLIPVELNKFSNLKHITVEEFKNMFNIAPSQTK